MDNGFLIGVIVAIIAIFSVFFKGNKKGGRSTNPYFLLIGISAAIIGLIGYLFFGWRF